LDPAPDTQKPVRVTASTASSSTAETPIATLPSSEAIVAALASRQVETTETIPVNEVLAEERPVGSTPVVPPPDPSDYTVTLDGHITVQAAETLGHYAEWLEVATSRLRRLNGMSYGTPVAIGRQAKLDFSEVTPEIFEHRRLDFHQALQEEFFDAYEVVGTDAHQLKRGDTLWELAEVRYRIPIWLLRQYNPTLDFSALQRGARLIIPRIQPRQA
jgi:membrane-bound lytic murein transglycosylase D